MKKRIFKRTVAMLMAATMLFSMVGCGKKDDDKKKVKKDTKNMTYEGQEFAAEGLEGDVSTFFVSGDRLYIETYEWIPGEDSEMDVEPLAKDVDAEEGDDEGTSEEVTSEETTSEEETSEETDEDAEEGDEEEIDWDEYDYGTDITRFYSMKLDGTDLKEMTVPGFGENEWMYDMGIDHEGNFVFLTNEYNPDTEKSKVFIYKADEDGNEIFKEDVTKALKMNEESYVDTMLVDGKGRIVVSVSGAGNGAEIFILDEKAKLTGSVKVDYWVEGMAKTKDGNIVCAYSDDKEGTVVKVLDVDKKEFGEKYKIDVQYLNGSGSLMDGIEYDFYYRTDSGIFGYDIASQKATQVIDFVASNMPSEATYDVVPIAKDKMIGTYYEGESSKFMLYTKVDPSTITDKQVITFGAAWIDDSLKKAAIDFNKKSKDYRIEFIDYSDAEDPEAKMNAEIAAGNIPDILDVSGGTDQMYAAKGMLEDLMPYLEKDPDMSPDDFLPTALEAMKTGDKLYSVSPSFSITTLIGRSSQVGTEIGWTFDDMKKLLDETEGKARPFTDNYKQNMIYTFAYSYGDFIDWETGECSFDSQDFKDILEVCNSGIDGEPNYDEEMDYVSGYQNGEVLFMEGWINMEEMQMYNEMFGEEITFIGYPNKDKSGSYFQMNTKVAISSKSDVKDAAWEFVRTLMTKEYQGKQGNIWDIPVRKDCYGMMVKAKTTTESYTDEFGQKVDPVEGGMGWDDLMIELKPLSQEDVDKFNELIENTHKCSSYDWKIIEIIQEETKPYFAGEKDVDATADVIQSRIKTYVNENR